MIDWLHLSAQRHDFESEGKRIVIARLCHARDDARGPQLEQHQIGRSPKHLSEYPERAARGLARPAARDADEGAAGVRNAPVVALTHFARGNDHEFAAPFTLSGTAAHGTATMHGAASQPLSCIVADLLGPDHHPARVFPSAANCIRSLHAKAA